MTAMELAQSLQALVSELDGAAEDLLQAEYGITHSQLAFLRPLVLHGDLDVTSLAGHVGVSAAAVSKRVGWFESRSLVRAAHPEGDGKRLVIGLTPAGRRMAGSAMARLAERLDELLVDWPPAQRDQLKALSSQLAETVRRGRENAQREAS